MESAYKDQIYMEIVRPVELKFIDVGNIVFSVGQDLTVIDDCKGVLPVTTGY